MFRDMYRQEMEKIEPGRELIDKTVAAMDARGGAGRPFYRSPAILAAVLILSVLAATPVLAASVPAAYGLLYAVSPATAQYFMPVERSSEDNGIRMEVKAVYIHADKAEIYIALTDLTGDRIDATTDLYDSYAIHRPFDASARCRPAGYDPETRTATFLIEVTQWGDQAIDGRKMTFSVGAFISGKEVHEDVPIDIDLSAIDTSAPMKEPGIFTGGGGRAFDKYADAGAPAVLAASGVVAPIVDGIDLAGVGYADGRLHVQTRVADPLSRDNHGVFFLKDSAGRVIESDYAASFIEYGTPGDEDTRIAYTDHVFVVPEGTAAACSLYGTFYTSGRYTRGNWQVTFPLTPAAAGEDGG